MSCEFDLMPRVHTDLDSLDPTQSVIKLRRASCCDERLFEPIICKQPYDTVGKAKSVINVVIVKHCDTTLEISSPHPIQPRTNIQTRSSSEHSRKKALLIKETRSNWQFIPSSLQLESISFNFILNI